ncbi:MAG: porin [Verrucomicrobiota bacterium]
MRNMQQTARFAAVVTFSSLCLGSAALAEDAVSTPDFLKDIFDAATLYDNKDNPYLQKLAFTGRAQFDYAHSDGEGMLPGGPSDESLDYDDFNTRRLRAGFKATLFEDFTLHAEADFQPEEDPVYQRLTDVYVGWKHSDAFNVKLGKQGVGFTLDGSTSSKELLTIDRNNLSNNLWFTSEYMPGVSFSGKIDNWVYTTGVFSQGGEDQEFGDFDAGATFLATIGYDFAKCLGSDEALLTFNYVYNNPDDSGTSLFSNRSLENIGSLNFSYLKDSFGFRTDLSAAEGYASQPNLWGFVAMPFYNFNDKLQGVMRYTLVDSDGDNGVRYSNYESSLMLGSKGDFYQEIYTGLNYYIYGQKLKLQAGLAYLDMQDDANDGGEFSGLSFQTGLRISW